MFSHFSRCPVLCESYIPSAEEELDEMEEPGGTGYACKSKHIKYRIHPPTYPPRICYPLSILRREAIIDVMCARVDKFNSQPTPLAYITATKPRRITAHQMQCNASGDIAGYSTHWLAYALQSTSLSVFNAIIEGNCGIDSVTREAFPIPLEAIAHNPGPPGTSTRETTEL